MLRRRKAEVLTQLPERVDNTLLVPMTEQQRKHHDENGDIVARIVQRWRKSGYLSDSDQRLLTCALQNMRMSCNSTWLLDHETDFGHKADELITVLDELFEQPDAKAVVFSQWLGTHEVLMRRLRLRGWGHVLFSGSVPGPQRAALVDRFNGDPDCRLFLSTDAGGVGLNLQHAAATVVNMDLPWNPAVLEQRIGRVHRMGQRRGVQVINFVAQGSIEQGMLGLLAFKKSLFAGVLDGGDSAVFMNGTRLNQFMESVDEVTGAMGLAEAAEVPASVTPGAAAPAEPGGAAAPAEWERAAAPAEPGVSTAAHTAAPSQTPTPMPAAAPLADPWGTLLEAGAALIEQLAAGPAAKSPWVETDATTGQPFLKLPLPEPAALQRLLTGLSSLLAGLRPPGH